MCLMRCALSSGKMPVRCTSRSTEIACRLPGGTRKTLFRCANHFLSAGPAWEDLAPNAGVRAQIAELWQKKESWGCGWCGLRKWSPGLNTASDSAESPAAETSTPGATKEQQP